MKKPKILLYDIETAPNLAYVWGKWQQDVIAYEKERELLCFAYQWHGEDKITCVTRENDKTDEKVTRKLADLLQQADITVAHNGDEFDRKVVKSRMLYWNMKPLKINCSVDTKKVAKTYFEFNGNGLADLVKFLKLGEKAHTPGFDMWLGCMRGSKKSWAQMAYYNKHDVRLLAKLYKRFLPWIENHPNIYKLLNPLIKLSACPSCTSLNIAKNGYRVTLSAVAQRVNCLDCGKQFLTKVDKK